MDTVRTCDDRRHRICNGEAAVAVTVPVDANLLTGRLNDFFHHKPHEGQRSHWRGVASRIADTNRAGTAFNGRRIETLHRLRIAAARVLGDVHYVEPERNGILDSF